MNMIRDFLGRIFKRNYAIAEVQNLRSPAPVYNNWSIKKAVAEGYGSNVWVYRSVNLIVKNLSTIPWVVRRDQEDLPDHHLSRLFRTPNDSISNNDMWELFYSWLELAGNAYGFKIKSGHETTAIVPVSPDRIDPVQGATVDEWINSYTLDKNNRTTKKSFDPSEILHLKFFNPANPLLGIGPLQAAAKVVDVDNDQIDWTKSTTQNRGVIDGMFTFERPFESIDDADAIAESINQKYAGKKNARKIGVLGGNAKYHRTALTPVEADYGGSRKSNRDEIFIAFGVPPQLGGSQETATYNNYETSLLIFWFSTLIPILDDTKASLNFEFKDELMPGETIEYSIVGVQAIRKALLEGSQTAEKLFKMGVPFETLNKIFKFGVEEFEGWEKSYVQTSTSGALNPSEDRSVDEIAAKFTLIEKRTTEEDVEKASEKNQKVFDRLLTNQKNIVFKNMESGKSVDDNFVEQTKDDWLKAVGKIFVDVGVEFGSEIIAESQRQVEDPLTKSIMTYLEDEMVVLTDVTFMLQATAELVVQHVAEGLKEGSSTAQIQQAIIDSGAFSAERALRLARTITGNAANLGQIQGALLTGATHKTWMTAASHVRDTHKKLDNKTIPIDDLFNVGGHHARYPLDNKLPPGERVNCRCTLTYSIE